MGGYFEISPKKGKNLLDTFPEANCYKGVATSTWRVYFASFTCPEVVVRVGKVCEQIAFGKHLSHVRSKNNPIPIERPRYGRRGPCCLDLGDIATPTAVAPKPMKKTAEIAFVVTRKSMDCQLPT